MWKKLHKLLLDKLNDAGEIGWSRVSLDSATIPAKGVKKGSKLQARTRRIRENQARRAILWCADEVYESSRRSPPLPALLALPPSNSV